MRRFSALCIFIGILSMSTATLSDKQISLNQTAWFVRGFIAAAAQKDMLVVHCAQDLEGLQKVLTSAVQAFSINTFSSQRKALRLMGSGIELFPFMLKSCDITEQMLTDLKSKAQVFQHPLTFSYIPQMKLVVNVVDITTMINMALNEVSVGDCYKFGKIFGSAMTGVSSMDSRTKKPIDEQAYTFLNAFIMGLKMQSNYDQQSLFNKINNLGSMVFGPVQQAMQNFDEKEGEEAIRIYMSLHEISHSLLEGVTSLAAIGALTAKNQLELSAYAQCIQNSDSKEDNSIVSSLFAKANAAFDSSTFEELGSLLAQITFKLCKPTLNLV